MHLFERGYSQLLILILLILGLAVAFILFQEKQIFSPKAASEFSLDGFKSTFNECKGDKKYDPQYDPNNDGCITIQDYSLLIPRFLAQQVVK